MTSEQTARSARWIPVRGGFLCDPFGGEVVIRDGVAYWASNGDEHALDLSAAARAEADRRNGLSAVFPSES